MATDNIKNYPLFGNAQLTDRVKIYSQKNRFAPAAISLQTLMSAIGGGGLESTTTFDVSGITVTSSFINGEEVDFLILDTGTGSIIEQTFTATGTLFTYTASGSDYRSFIGLAVRANNQTTELHSSNDNAGRIFVTWRSLSQDYNQEHHAYTTDNNATVDVNTFTPYFDNKHYFIYQHYTGGVQDVDKQIVVNPNNTENELQLKDNVANTTQTYIPYQYLEVDITSPEILAMGTSPITLLPAPAADEYYEFKITFEYTFVSAWYELGATDDVMISGPSYAGAKLLRYLIEDAGVGGVNKVITMSSDASAVETAYNAGFVTSYGSTCGTPILLSTLLGNDPTLGDGTIKAKIWYNIKTFG